MVYAEQYAEDIKPYEQELNNEGEEQLVEWSGRTGDVIDGADMYLCATVTSSQTFLRQVSNDSINTCLQPNLKD